MPPRISRRLPREGPADPKGTREIMEKAQGGFQADVGANHLLPAGHATANDEARNWSGPRRGGDSLRRRPLGPAREGPRSSLAFAAPGTFLRRRPYGKAWGQPHVGRKTGSAGAGTHGGRAGSAPESPRRGPQKCRRVGQTVGEADVARRHRTSLPAPNSPHFGGRHTLGGRLGPRVGDEQQLIEVLAWFVGPSTNRRAPMTLNSLAFEPRGGTGTIPPGCPR